MAKHKTIGDNPALSDVLPALPHDTQSHAFFSTPEAMANYIEERTAIHTAWDKTAWDEERGAGGFCGTPNMLAALKLCRDGWQDGATTVARIREKIMIENPQRAEYARWDVAGAYPSVARAVSGNPLHMRRKDFADTHKRPVLTIVHHCGGLAETQSTSFANKAAVVAAIVDVAEDAGYSVELIAVSASARSADGPTFVHETAVIVKRAGDPVDVARLAFAVGHPSFFRRMVFALRGSDRFNAPLTCTLGRTCDYQQTAPQGVYMLPSIRGNEDKFNTEQAALTKGLSFYLDILAKQGCPPFQNRLAA